MLVKKQKGFTLIELLVVISIISLLAMMAVTQVQNSRMKSRDAKRLADLRQIGTALQLFYDEYGYYPDHRDQTNATGCGSGAWGNRSSSALCGGDQWLTADPNFAQFMAHIPVDPINTGFYAEDDDYTYTYNGGADDYDLRALLEDENNPYRCEAKCYFVNIGTCHPEGNAWCADTCGGTPFWGTASREQLYSDHQS